MANERALSNRFIVGCPGSGSTLLMKIFAESPLCVVPRRKVSTDAATTVFEFVEGLAAESDKSREEILRSAFHEGRRVFLFAAEPCSDAHTGKCRTSVLDICDEAVLPVFCIRDPVRVFDIWKKEGRSDWKTLVHCFKRLLQYTSGNGQILYEQLVEDPREELSKICSYWEIPFTDNLTRVTKSDGPYFLSKSGESVRILREKSPPTKRKLAHSVIQDVTYYDIVSNVEKDMIERAVGSAYISRWGGQAVALRNILMERPWFAFDLDDTLHEFRRASSKASDVVLKTIHQWHKVPLPDLKATYSEILELSTPAAFTDGRSSQEYREPRFRAVAENYELTIHGEDMAHLLRLYKKSLKDSLGLKSGTLELFSTLKGLGKMIAVITEGPQDAQEWTLERLRLTGYVDFLATSGHFEASKTDGLIPMVLDHLEITADDVVYIGDSEERDIKPAMTNGLLCVHLSEKENCNLGLRPPHVNTLNKLTHILRSSSK
ncbi:hypothetical protein PG993_005602 [Apiospora rasikravindrae]|uniref:Uncharacterized protein n=1 Tax=Apiospora rasikravindrae TaxID=990691 RepID=A0ABR1TG23_9PEZI